MSVALVALGATVHTDRRDIPMPGLHRLPGDEPERDTVLEPGELIVADHRPGPARASHRYRKVRDRASYAFALVSIATVVDGRDARIALGSVAHVPWRCERRRGRLPRDGRRRRGRRRGARARRARCATTPSRSRSPAT